MLVKRLFPVLVLASLAAAAGAFTFIAFKVELLLW
jgi:hypothetical protein